MPPGAQPDRILQSAVKQRQRGGHLWANRRRLEEPRRDGLNRFDERMMTTSAPVKSIAHVLYMDVIGSGLLPAERQRAVYQELNDVVLGSAEYRRAGARGEVICRPSGDGMALVFFEGVESPMLSALEISELLRSRPHLQLRMGIRSGEVFRVTDINGSDDVTGDGIVMARRVMDCGDAAHVLVSASVMDGIGKSSWEPSLHYLGVCEVKHGQRIALWNLYTTEVGNPKLPRIMVEQLAQQAISAHRKAPGIRAHHAARVAGGGHGSRGLDRHLLRGQPAPGFDPRRDPACLPGCAGAGQALIPTSASSYGSPSARRPPSPRRSARPTAGPCRWRSPASTPGSSSSAPASRARCP